MNNNSLEDESGTRNQLSCSVLPLYTVLCTVHITIAAALASKPEVGSSMKIIDGFETRSTVIVNLFHCSVDNLDIPGRPTSASLKLSNSTSSMTSSTKAVLVSLSTSFGRRRNVEYNKDSLTVTYGECISFYSQELEIRAKVSWLLGNPKIRISPSMYPPVFLPAKTSLRVVFPSPLTLINAVRTPGLNAKSNHKHARDLQSRKRI